MVHAGITFLLTGVHVRVGGIVCAVNCVVLPRVRGDIATVKLATVANLGTPVLAFLLAKTVPREANHQGSYERKLLCPKLSLMICWIQ